MAQEERVDQTIGGAVSQRQRRRVKWYVSLALFNTLKLSELIGVRP
jgi:hypothetical protein